MRRQHYASSSHSRPSSSGGRYPTYSDESRYRSVHRRHSPPSTPHRRPSDSAMHKELSSPRAKRPAPSEERSVQIRTGGRKLAPKPPGNHYVALGRQTSHNSRKRSKSRSSERPAPQQFTPNTSNDMYLGGKQRPTPADRDPSSATRVAIPSERDYSTGNQAQTPSARSYSAGKQTPTPSHRSYQTGNNVRSEKRERSPSAARSRSRSKKETRGRSLSTGRSEATKKTIEEGDKFRTELEKAKDDLEKSQKELEKLQMQKKKIDEQIQTQQYKVMDHSVVVESLEKRQRLQQEFYGQQRGGEERQKSSKRRRIVDEDDEEEEDDDDDVVIIEPEQVKQEPARDAPDKIPEASVDREAQTSRSCGGKSSPELLSQWRVNYFPDNMPRKARLLAFNPAVPELFTTASDDGALKIWRYDSKRQSLDGVVQLDSYALRNEAPCAESMCWSPDGNRIALAFRDPLDNKGEFCVARLHNMELRNCQRPQKLAEDRLTRMRTGLHPRGVTAVQWLPEGSGEALTSRRLVTAGRHHSIMIWNVQQSSIDNGRNLHVQHKSEVRSLCIHSDRRRMLSGGLDGLVLLCDMERGDVETVVEKRKPTLCKMNDVSENPMDPNLVMVSSISATEHKLLMKDLRVRGEVMSLLAGTQGLSQYLVPRWRPNGNHVACGNKQGAVNVWDIRCGDGDVSPHQTQAIHNKSVLHANWHPTENALVTVSSDRNLGLLTFR